MKIKKTFLKMILCATAIMAGAGFFAPIVVQAEENTDIVSTQETLENSAETNETENVSTEEATSENQAEIVAKTNANEWFEETLMPLIIQYGTEVLAFATVVMIALNDLNKTKSTLGIAVGALTKSNTDNKDTSKAVKELKSEYAKQMSEMQAEMKRIGNMFVEAVNEIKASLSDKVNDADGKLNALLEVEKLAYGDQAKLVSNGTAKRIAEVVNGGKVKDKE
jgi:hypothetical protein